MKWKLKLSILLGISILLIVGFYLRGNMQQELTKLTQNKITGNLYADTLKPNVITIGNITKKLTPKINKEHNWNILKIENGTTVYIDDKKSNTPLICEVYPNAQNKNDLPSRNVYSKKDKTLKKTIVQEKVNGYWADCFQADSNYVQIGDNSTIVQDFFNTLVLDYNGGQINVSVTREDGTIDGMFIHNNSNSLKFGFRDSSVANNTLNNYTYFIQSTQSLFNPNNSTIIYTLNELPLLQNIIDFNQTCSSNYSNCQINQIDDNTYKIDFTSYNYDDPDINQTACGVLTTNNTRYLIQNNISTTTNCLTINANNISIDFQGYTIYSTLGSCLFSSGTSLRTNITIANGFIKKFANGFSAPYLNNVTINNMTFYGFTTSGIVVSTSNDRFNITNVNSTGGQNGFNIANAVALNISLDKLIVYNNSNYGITISGGVVNITNSLIYNNTNGINFAGFNPIIKNDIIFNNSNGIVISTSNLSLSGNNITANKVGITITTANINVTNLTLTNTQQDIKVVNYGLAYYNLSKDIKADLTNPFGEINITVNASNGTALFMNTSNSDIQISNLNAYVNHSRSWLNNPSNITFLGVKMHDIQTMKDGFNCNATTSAPCINLSTNSQLNLPYSFSVVNWSNYTLNGSQCFYGMNGSGGNLDACIVTTCYQLQFMNLTVNQNYTLNNSIDCGNDTNSSSGALWRGGYGWNPIPSYSGTLDGKGFNVTKLMFRNTANSGAIFQGLTGTIKNLGFIDVNLTETSNYQMGVLTNGNSGTIDRCFLTGNVTGTNYIAGLTVTNNGIINNSWSALNMNCAGYCGQIATTNNNIIQNSYSAGNITGATYQYIGGISGTHQGGSITNCYSTTFINSTGGGYYMGGIAGNNQAPISNCYSSGNISGAGNTCGGLVGYENSGSSISNSFSTSNISCSGANGIAIGNYNGGSASTIYWFNRSNGVNCASSGNSNCITVNNISYFQGTSSVAPMSSWSFTNIWKVVANDYPHFIWEFPTSIITCWTKTGTGKGSILYKPKGCLYQINKSGISQ